MRYLFIFFLLLYGFLLSHVDTNSSSSYSRWRNSRIFSPWLALVQSYYSCWKGLGCTLPNAQACWYANMKGDSCYACIPTFYGIHRNSYCYDTLALCNKYVTDWYACNTFPRKNVYGLCFYQGSRALVLWTKTVLSGAHRSMILSRWNPRGLWTTQLFSLILFAKYRISHKNKGTLAFVFLCSQKSASLHSVENMQEDSSTILPLIMFVP